MSKKENIKILGELEEEIMNVVWRLKKGTVREVLDNINRSKIPAYTTVMTVMARLNKKGLLKRKLVNDSYVYQPTKDKENFLASTSKKVIKNLFKNFGEDLAIAQFIDHIENIDIEKSKELRKKLQNIIKE